MIELVEIIISMFKDMPKDISLGRMTESVILFLIIWSKLKPHLKKIEDRLAGLELAVQNGLTSVETRFEKIEKRIEKIESGDKNGSFRETTFA